MRPKQPLAVVVIIDFLILVSPGQRMDLLGYVEAIDLMSPRSVFILLNTHADSTVVMVLSYLFIVFGCYLAVLLCIKVAE